MDAVSKLTLSGKAGTITLDADAGGIWLTPHGAGNTGKGSICLVFGTRITAAPYVGLYATDHKQSDHGCDAALGAADDGAFLQTTVDGKVRTLKVADALRMMDAMAVTE